MDKRSIDEQITDRLSGITIMPSDAVWQKVGERLDQRKRKRALLLWWIPALMLTAGSAAFWSHTQQNGNRERIESSAIHTEKQRKSNQHSVPSFPNGKKTVIEVASGKIMATKPSDLSYAREFVSLIKDDPIVNTKEDNTSMTEQQGQNEPIILLGYTETAKDTTEKIPATVATVSTPEIKPLGTNNQRSSGWTVRLGAGAGLASAGSWHAFSGSSDAMRLMNAGIAMPSTAAPVPAKVRWLGPQFHFHFYAEKTLSKRISVISGLGILASRISNDGNRQSFKLLELPMQVSYKTNPGAGLPINIISGISFGSVLTQDIEKWNNYLSISPPNDFSRQQWQFTTGIFTTFFSKSKHPMTVGLGERIGLNPLRIPTEYQKQRLYATTMEVRWTLVHR